MSVYKIAGTLGSDGKFVIAREVPFEIEDHLEKLFENSPFGLNQDEYILWIGKHPQGQNEDKTIIPDLLGVDSAGNLIIVEFKRGRTPRDVIAQLLVYAAWASELSETEIIDIAETYFLTRDGNEAKFNDRFGDVFDIPDVSDRPALNKSMRLFIVAENAHEELSHVCRWMRTSLGLDITCIEVSLFQTDLDETYIDMEVKVGEEDITATYLKPLKRTPKSSSQKRSSDNTGRDNVFQVVKQHTGEDKSIEWTIDEIYRIVSEKYEDINKNLVTGAVHAGCVNSPSRQYHPGGEDRYWKVRKGVYKLLDEESVNIPDTPK